MLRIRVGTEKLAEQLSFRNQAETALLNGEYDLAKDLQKKVDGVGVSLWSLGMMFRIAEFEYGTQYNRTSLKSFLQTESTSPPDRWARYMASMLSLQAEHELPSDDYLDITKYLDAVTPDNDKYTNTYLKYKLRRQIPDDDSSLSGVLHLEDSQSLLDLYDTCTFLLSELNNHEIDSHTAGYVKGVISMLEDTSLQSSAVMLTDGEVRPKQLSSALPTAASSSFCGDFAKCIDEAIKAIKESPRHFAPYQLLASAIAATRNLRLLDRVESKPQRELASAVYQWFDAEGNRSKSIEQLKRLSRVHGGTALGWGIEGFVRSQSNSGDALSTERIGIVASAISLPQHALCVPAGRTYAHERIARAVTRSDEFTSHGIDCLSGQLAPLLPSGMPGSAVDARKIHISAIGHALANKKAIACKLLSQLRQDYYEYYSARPDAQVLEANCLFGVNDFESAADLTASIYASNAGALPPCLLDAFLNLVIDDNRLHEKGNPAWAIIAAALHARASQSVPLDRVHDFVSDYIESNGCTLPTELVKKFGEDLPLDAYTFLRDCCTIDVMESSFWIASQEELLRERLVLCEAIRARIQPKGIEGEIALLMRRLAVMDITHRIARSRIYVDVGKVKKRLPESLSDSVRRLLAIVALKNEETQRGLKLLGMPSPEGGKILFVEVSRAAETLEHVISKVREVYLYSPELGLDANLSQSIRHGPIISEIRAIFDGQQLTTRQVGDGNYAPNAHWTDIAADDVLDADLFERAFSQLSREADEYASYLRLEIVQIRSDSTPEGLFDYSFSDEEIEEALLQIEPLHDVEDVYDLVIDLLVLKTEASMKTIKDSIATHWHDRLNSMLTTFSEQVDASLRPGSCKSLLRTAVTDCRTAMPRFLDQLADWFAHEDRTESNPFSVRDLAKSFEDIAAKNNRECRVQFGTADGSPDYTISGEFFRPLWDMYFILFDNAIKHGKSGELTIGVIANVDQNSAEFTVTNAIAEDAALLHLQESVQHLNGLDLSERANLLKLRSEGNSGIAKLHKIAKYEIGGGASKYSVLLSVEEDRVFKATVNVKRGLIG